MSTLWTPAEITAQLWLKGNDSATLTLDGSGNVEQWNDKSGNDRHAAQATPGNRPTPTTTNGKTSLDFTGNGVTMNVADQLPAGSYTHFLITEGNAITQFSIFGAGNNTFVPIASSTTSTNILRINGSNDPSGAFIYVNGETSQSLTTRVALRDAISNGGVVLSIFGNIPAITATMELGQGGGIGTFSWKDSIAEWIIVDASISLEDRQKVEGYLAHEWGIASKLPAEHPYKTEAPALPDDTSTGDATSTATGGSSGSSGSSGAASRLTPLGLFLVRMSLPDEANSEPAPEPALPSGPPIEFDLLLRGDIESSKTVIDGRVSEWRDQSGLDRHFSQGTVANRPFDAVGGVSFQNSAALDTGADDLQSLNRLEPGILMIGDEFTGWAVISGNEHSSVDGGIFSANGTTDQRFTTAYTSEFKVRGVTEASAQYDSGNQSGTSGRALVQFRKTADSVFAKVCGGSESTNGPYIEPTGMNNHSIGTDRLNNNFVFPSSGLRGTVHAVAIKEGATTEQERADVCAWLSALYL